MVRIFIISKLESIQLQSFDEYRFLFYKKYRFKPYILWYDVYSVVQHCLSSYSKLKIYFMQYIREGYYGYLVIDFSVLWIYFMVNVKEVFSWEILH